MCIFTAPVRKVHKTRILVSPLAKNNRQLIVYENQVEQHGKNAMVLPVPSGQNIELVDLSKYRGNVWDDCESMFPPPSPAWGGSQAASLSFGSSGPKRPPLPVQRVGGYSCTIVPALEDFDRVSKDVFYLPPDIEAILKQYYPQGFSFVVCVFQGDVRAHPIAYTSARLPNGQLFVPTLHAHGNGGAAHLHLGGEPVHVNVFCDVCGATPVIGHRWKCSQCPNYDMCNSCYTQKRGVHDVEHSFIHIVSPTQQYQQQQIDYIPMPGMGDSIRAEPVFIFGDPFKRNGSGERGVGGDTFDHTLYLINCVLVASPSRYDTIETCIPHKKAALYQLEVPHADCISKVNIVGHYPNKDYTCVEVQ